MIKRITAEERDRRLEELRNKANVKKSTPKETKSKIQDNVAEVKKEIKINQRSIMKDEKFIYTLKCDRGHRGTKELTERQLEQFIAIPHENCGGKIRVIDRKTSETNSSIGQSNTPSTIKHLNTQSNEPFYNAKIDVKFNPCKGNCYFNGDSNSYNVNLARGWKCPKTAEHIIACQNLVIHEELKKISEKGLAVNTEIQPDELNIKYDDGHTVKVNVKDIRRLFVIRSCFSKQDPNIPEKFGIMEIKDEWGEVLCDEPLTNEIIVKSLKGEITIGVHQTNKKGRVKWLCYDIDKKHVKQGEPKDLAESLVKYLKEWYGLTGYIEKSGSVDSFHVWLFFEPTKKEIAYKFHTDFESKLRNEGIEVDGFEKVISIDGGKGYGVMIKLPFNIQRKNGGKSEFLGDLSKIQPETCPEIK